MGMSTGYFLSCFLLQNIKVRHFNHIDSLVNIIFETMIVQECPIMPVLLSVVEGDHGVLLWVT